MMNKKMINVLSAAALTFSISAAPSSVWAQEDGSNKEDVSAESTTTVQMKDDWTLNDEEVKFEYGQMFNFLDSLTQHFKLALEQDDMEKAKLYAEYGQKRIAEAKALLEEGKDKEAAELLEQATKAMEKAEELSQDEKEEELASDENEEDSNKESNEDTESDEEQSEEKSDEDTESNEAEEDQSEDENAELEAKLGQNVISLKLAMEKVKNPVAKQALQRNIEKSLQRLEAKYGDIDGVKKRLKEIEEQDEETSSNKDELSAETKEPTENVNEQSEKESNGEEELEENGNPNIPAHAKKHKQAAKDLKEEMKERIKEKKEEMKNKRLEGKGKWKKQVDEDDDHRKGKNRLHGGNSHKDKGHNRGNSGKGSPHRN